MTRQEFIEDVNSFGALISFCQDESIDICDDIYDAEYFNEFILEIISQMRDWEDVRGYLSGIPVRCSYYCEDGYGSYEDADYMFDDYKQDVIRYMDDTASWDEEDEDEQGYDDAEDYSPPHRAEPEEEIETHSFMTVLGRAS